MQLLKYEEKIQKKKLVVSRELSKESFEVTSKSNKEIYEEPFEVYLKDSQ